MSKTQRPPLTPAESEYLGLDSDDHHLLRWRSQSRPDLTHDTFMDSFGVNYWCTCEWYAHHGECKHGRAALDALAHHGVRFEPPPADPGGAALDAAQADLDGEMAGWEAELRKIRHDEGLKALYGN